MTMRENAGLDKSSSHQKAESGLVCTFPRFIDLDVDDACVAGLVDVAPPAPSEWNLQSWRWIVVRGQGAKNFLEDATYMKVPLGQAPVILICLADTLAWKSASQYLEAIVASRQITEQEGQEALRRIREYYSSSPESARRTTLAKTTVAVHQILLRAAENNLAACWVTEFDESKIKTHFHIPDHFLIAALLPIGYQRESPAPDVSPPPSRKLIYREKFGHPFVPGVPR